MKKILFFSILVIALTLSTAFAGSVVKLGAKITDETYKEKYSKGDTLTVRLTIDEACDNFGLLMGIFKFDDNYLEIVNCRAENVNVVENGEVSGTIQATFFDAAGENTPDQIIFWIEDKYNEMSTGALGRIKFTVTKEVSAKDLQFSFLKMQASDYELKNNYKCESNVTSINIVESSASKEEEKQLEENLSDIKEQAEETLKEKVELIENTIYEEKKDDSSKEQIKTEPTKEETKTDKKESTKSETSKTSTQSADTSTGSKETKSEKESKGVSWSKASSWAEKELQSANNNKLIPETLANKDFTTPITRKDFAAIAVKLYENLAGKEIKTTITNPFSDVNDEYVTKAYEVGITDGTNKEKKLFSPDNEITREQMATMIVRALNKVGKDTSTIKDNLEKFVDEDQMHSWGIDAIYYMFNKGIIKGVSTYENRFGVLDNATIEQAIAISLRCVNTLKQN